MQENFILFNQKWQKKISTNELFKRTCTQLFALANQKASHRYTSVVHIFVVVYSCALDMWRLCFYTHDTLNCVHVRWMICLLLKMKLSVACYQFANAMKKKSNKLLYISSMMVLFMRLWCNGTWKIINNINT